MSTTARHRRRLARALTLTAGCLAFAGTAALATAADAQPSGRSAAAAASAIVDRTQPTQRGPVIVIAARLRTSHPYGSGTLILRSLPGGKLLGSAHPGGRGVASFIVPLPGALPGMHGSRSRSPPTTAISTSRPRAR